MQADHLSLEALADIKGEPEGLSGIVHAIEGHHDALVGHISLSLGCRGHE